MTRPLLLCLVLTLGHHVPALGHELPDGVIERRVQLSVKSDCVLVAYSLEMNETTLEEELRKSGLKPAATPAEKWKQSQKAILSSLSKRILVTLDGDRQAIKPIRADYSGWSHPRLTCLLKADIELTEDLKTIVVTDRNFLDVPGSYRIAMKGRSGAKLIKASAPTLLSRAKPVALAKLPKQKRQAAARVEGQFVLAKQPVN